MSNKTQEYPTSINAYVRDIAIDVQDGLCLADPQLSTPENVGLIVSAIIRSDIIERRKDTLDGEKYFLKKDDKLC